MKKNNLIALFLITMLFSCNKKDETIATAQFEKEINIGTVIVNDTVKKQLKIKNTSDIPLTIRQVKTSCGCTVAEIKDSVVQAHNSTEITIQFIADKDKVGKINKSIVFDANTKPNFNVVYLRGVVKE